MTVPSPYVGFGRGLLISAALWLLGGCEAGTESPSRALEPARSLPQGVVGQSQLSLREAARAALADGLESLFIDTDEASIWLIQGATDRLEPVLVAAPQEGTSAQAALRNQGLQALVGSGFVSELHSLQPVGLLQVDGAVLNAMESHGYTRILGINDTGLGVVHRNSYERSLFHSALQVGPGIVERGLLDIAERELQRPTYFRSFVALCDTHWVIGASLIPMHLRTMGRTLAHYFTQQGWNCPEIINLAGDRQAVMLLQTREGLAFHGDPDTYKVSLLGFRTKSEP